MRELSGDDQAALVYLVLLLVVVGGSMLIGTRKQLNTSLQQLVIWGLIFIGAIGAYSIRDQITAQLYPSHPRLMDQGTVAFNRARDGHFYADVEVNGKRITFVVDTGASDIVLNYADAQKVGIDLDRLVYTDQANTANGLVPIAHTQLDSVVLGRFIDRNILATVNGGELDTSLLGMRYLRRFRSIEITGGRMILTR